MTRLLADARAIVATRAARRILAVVAVGLVVVAAVVAAEVVARNGHAGMLTAVKASDRVYTAELLAYLTIVAMLPLWWLVAMLTPRPGRDVPHRPDRPRVEGSARTGPRPAFPGARPITLTGGAR